MTLRWYPNSTDAFPYTHPSTGNRPRPPSTYRQRDRYNLFSINSGNQRYGAPFSSAHASDTLPLRRLRITLRPSDTHQLPLRILYHHLLISARSHLIPRDRHLSLTIDNTIHTMTPNDTHDPSIRLHSLHLFLNPSTDFPYLLCTFAGQPNANPLPL